MANLVNHLVGDVVAEWVGPVTGRNYNVAQVASPKTAQVEIQVFGTGTVKLQTCTVATLRSATSGTNAFSYDRVPSLLSTDWSDIGSPLSSSGGYTVFAVTPNDHACWLRIVVTVAGTGNVIIKSNWV